jgi:hypothetical protein
MCSTNVGNTESSGPNGFIVQLPPGVTIPNQGVLEPGPGTPQGTGLLALTGYTASAQM